MATQSSPHTTGHTSFPSNRGGGSSSNMHGGRGGCRGRAMVAGSTSHLPGATSGMASSSPNGLLNRGLLLLHILDLKATGLPFNLFGPDLFPFRRKSLDHYDLFPP
ncbi:unnamed protein product [Prunus brigantina]